MRRSATHCIRLLGLALAWSAFAWPAPAAAQVSTNYVLGASYGTKPRSDPLYSENLFDLFYPLGGCPLSPGCDNTVYPVAIFIRGGNLNGAPLTSPDQLGEIQQSLLQQGFVVVRPNFHEIDVEGGEDYQTANRDLGRMVQYLRRFRTILNIDPERVFSFGRSGGGFYSLALGLNVDYRNPDSRDLVERESSRPNFIVPWGAATDFQCMDLDNPATNPALIEMFGAAGGDEAVLQASPVYWLQMPWLYDRTYTPPMCLVYDLTQQHACGTITDFHDGYFGPWMYDRIVRRYCGGAGQGESVCELSVLIDSGDPGFTNQAVVDWMVAMAAL